MQNDSNYKSEYIIQAEPGYKERADNWKTAIGLQKVDGLTPSDYLIQTANHNISGEISLQEAKARITEYYAQQPGIDQGNRIEEADKVSLRIVELLSQDTFNMSTLGLTSINKHLFDGIYPFAGKFRDYNISKKEMILGGDSVLYSSFDIIRETLDHDFAKEKEFDYAALGEGSKINHIANFISGLWQIHPFGEGNTRTVAVFAIKYLRKFGYDLTNDAFEKNSVYFRNALVRANYSNRQIPETREYLCAFFRNLLFGKNTILDNQALYIYAEPLKEQETSVAPGKKKDQGFSR